MSRSRQSSRGRELSVIDPVVQGQVLTCPRIVLAGRC